MRSRPCGGHYTPSQVRRTLSAVRSSSLVPVQRTRPLPSTTIVIGELGGQREILLDQQHRHPGAFEIDR